MSASIWLCAVAVSAAYWCAIAWLGVWAFLGTLALLAIAAVTVR